MVPDARRALGGRPLRAQLPLLPAPGRHLPRRRAAHRARREAPLRAAAGPGGATRRTSGSSRRWRARRTTSPAERARCSGFEVLDEATLEIRLDEPKAFFLHLVTLPATLVTRDGRAGKLLGHRALPPGAASTPTGVVLERNPTTSGPSAPCWTGWSSCSTRPGGRARAAPGAAAGRGLRPVRRARARRGSWSRTRSSPAPRPPAGSWASTCATPPFDDVRVRQGIRAGLDVAGDGGAVPSRRAGGSHAHPARAARTGGARLRRRAPDVALARAAAPRGGHRTAPAGARLPARRNTAAEDAVLFRPLIEAGLVELTHVEIDPTEFWQRAREGQLPAFRAGLDRRLPGRGQLPPLPPELERADRLRARATAAPSWTGSPPRRGCPSIPSCGCQLYRAAERSSPGLPAHPAVPRAHLRGGEPAGAGPAAAPHTAPGPLRRALAGRRRGLNLNASAGKARSPEPRRSPRAARRRAAASAPAPRGGTAGPRGSAPTGAPGRRSPRSRRGGAPTRRTRRHSLRSARRRAGS